MIWWLVLLFVVGTTLIVAEFIVPGAICGIIGGTMVVASGIIGVYHYPDYALFIIVGEVLGLALGVGIGLVLLSKLGAVSALRLDTSQRLEDGYVNMASDLSLIGATGLVLTALRPAGTIEIAGRRLDAVSEGTFIQEHTTVRVLEVHGNRLVVEAAEENK